MVKSDGNKPNWTELEYQLSSAEFKECKKRRN